MLFLTNLLIQKSSTVSFLGWCLALVMSQGSGWTEFGLIPWLSKKWLHLTWVPNEVYWNVQISKVTPWDTSSGQSRHISHNRDVLNHYNDMPNWYILYRSIPHTSRCWGNVNQRQMTTLINDWIKTYKYKHIKTNMPQVKHSMRIRKINREKETKCKKINE